jgi:N-acetylglucosaminyldiphosphoundecaprenol N-acetyl-beta-D-mannosaminyltransferase
MQSDLKRTNVLGVGVSSLNMEKAIDTLLQARANGQTGYVCVTGVHGVIESQRDPALKQIHNRSFLTVPDGMPTVWMGREQGFVHMGRVYGPDLMLKVLEATSLGGQAFGTGHSALGVGETASVASLESSTQRPMPSTQSPLTHFLYGATEETLKKLKTNLEARFPGVQIVGTYAPPFRPLNDQEEEELRKLVAECKPDFFWVGLSTPKQEKFMAGHSLANDSYKNYDLSIKQDADNLNPNHLKPKTSALKRFPLECGIMLGVGAAFPIHAGLQKDAPEWIKNSGLQWFHRLCQEPRRLWRRYLNIVPTFLWLSAMQLLGIKKYNFKSE